MRIRAGDAADLPGIVDLYNHYVRHTVATFFDAELSVEEWSDAYGVFSATGPHRLVVADLDGADDADGAEGDGIAGYACSWPYSPHHAFAETVEFSIYLRPEVTGKGLGSRLYSRLLAELEGESVHRAIVGIALPNDASVRLHKRFGFEEIGVFDEYAQKWGKFVSSMWMQRAM